MRLVAVIAVSILISCGDEPRPHEQGTSTPLRTANVGETGYTLAGIGAMKTKAGWSAQLRIANGSTANRDVEIIERDYLILPETAAVLVIQTGDMGGEINHERGICLIEFLSDTPASHGRVSVVHRGDRLWVMSRRVVHERPQ
jgi:hypothetical protein